MTATVNLIERRIGNLYVQPVDGGKLVIFKDAPFARRMGDPDDPKIKRIILQIRAEYLTA